MLNIGLSLAGFGSAHKYFSGAVAYGVARKIADLLASRGIVGQWEISVSNNGGTINSDSFAAASGFYSGLQLSTFKDKIIYFMPFLGTDINAAKTPLVDKLERGSPTTNTYTDAHFSQSSGIQAASSRYMILPLAPSDLNNSDQKGGLGVWELNTGRAGGINAEHVISSTNSTHFYSLQLYPSVETFYWGQTAASRWAQRSSPSFTGDFAYGQRSATNLLELYQSGIRRATEGSSDTPNMAGMPNFNLTRQQQNNGWVSSRLGMAVLTDGTLTTSEITGFRNLVVNTIMAPLGRVVSPWEQAVTAATGYLDSTSRTIGLTFLQQLETKTYKDKIKYLLPMLGTGINEALTPIINRVNGLRPLNNNFNNSDFTLTGGLQGDGTSKYLDLLIKPGQLGASNNGGLGYIENNLRYVNGLNLFPMGCYNNAVTEGYNLYLPNTTTRSFYWGDNTVAATQSLTPVNGHYYGQRSGTTFRELWVSGQFAVLQSATHSVVGINETNIRLMGTFTNAMCYWAGRCCAAYLTDGTMTSEEVADWNLTLNRSLLEPLGRVGKSPTGPTLIAGAKVWFDATQILGYSDGQTLIGAWNDSSPNRNHAVVVTAPTYKTNVINGQPVLRFGSKRLTFTFPILPARTGFTFFMVLRAANDSAGSSCFMSNGQGATTGTRWAFAAAGGGSQSVGWAGTAAGTDLGTTAFTNGTAYVMCWRKTSTGWLVYRNGTLISTVSDTSMPSGSTWIGVIGAENSAGQYATAGDIGEIIIYDEPLSTTDREWVQNYLGAKWGITIA